MRKAILFIVCISSMQSLLALAPRTDLEKATSQVLSYQHRSLELGGKGVGLFDLVELLDQVYQETRIQVFVPEFEVLTSSELWKPLLEKNHPLVQEGNYVIQNYSTMKLSLIENSKKKFVHLPYWNQYFDDVEVPIKDDQTAEEWIQNYLKYLSSQFKIDGLPLKSKLDQIQGKTIERSSDADEDQFHQSKAGAHDSLVANNTAGVYFNIVKMLQQYIFHSWYDERLNLEVKNFAIVHQRLIEGDASGVALSNGRGGIAIEGNLGKATTVVEQKAANSTFYDVLFSGNEIRLKVYQPFEKYPYEVDLNDVSWNRWKDPEKVRALWEANTHDLTTEEGSFKSPFTQLQIEQLARVVRVIEKKLGYAVDIEFTIKDHQIYLLQKRPRVLPPEEQVLLNLNIDPKTRTIASGKIYKSKKPMPVVIFSERAEVTDEALLALKRLYGESGYIKVQRDIISEEMFGRSIMIDGEKVLVDLNQGSRNAHNMLLFRDQHGSDYVYLAGPKLKPWFQSMHYQELVPGGGILISHEKLWVESNGDDQYGGFRLDSEIVDAQTQNPIFEQLMDLMKDKVNDEPIINHSLERLNLFLNSFDVFKIFSKDFRQWIAQLWSQYQITKRQDKNIGNVIQIDEMIAEYWLNQTNDDLDPLLEVLKPFDYFSRFRVLWPFSADSLSRDILFLFSQIYTTLSQWQNKPKFAYQSLQNILNRKKSELASMKSESEKKVREVNIQKLTAMIDRIRIKLGLAASDQKNNQRRDPLILIVDDNSVNRDITTRMILSGKNVTDQQLQKAMTVQQAIQTIQKDRPEIIILDHQLPDGDSFDLLRQIQVIEGYHPDITILSADRNLLDQSPVFTSLGATRILIKPVSMEIIRAFIKNLIDKLTPIAEKPFSVGFFDDDVAIYELGKTFL